MAMVYNAQLRKLLSGYRRLKRFGKVTICM